MVISATSQTLNNNTSNVTSEGLESYEPALNFLESIASSPIAMIIIGIIILKIMLGARRSFI